MMGFIRVCLFMTGWKGRGSLGIIVGDLKGCSARLMRFGDIGACPIDGWGTLGGRLKAA